MQKVIGAHSIIYTSNASADRKFFRDVLKLKSVDVGGGWLIYVLPPSELAFHPIYDKSSKDGDVEFYLMVDDVAGFAEDLKKKKVHCGKINDYGWGLMMEVTVPGGSKLMIYQPKHVRPTEKKSSSKPRQKAGKKKQ